MKHRYLCAAVAALGINTCLFAAGAKAQLAVTTERIGTFMGEVEDVATVPVARRHLMATDMGFTASWRSYGIMLFGDSMLSDANPPAANVADQNHDDAWGFWQMAGSSRNAVPTFNIYARTSRVKNRISGDLLMPGARTPAAIASFNQSFFWGLFARHGAYRTCSTDSGCDGLTCDTGLRVINPLPAPGEPVPNPVICFSSNPQCVQQTPGQTGLCRDSSTNNPMNSFDATNVTYYDAVGTSLTQSQQRRLLSVATVHEFGPNTAQELSTYNTVRWLTNKFTNVTMRATRTLTDYRLPASEPQIDNTLWIWGRPSYWTNTTRGAPAEMYLAMQYRTALPEQGDPATSLSLLYRKSDGTWSSNQNNAAKLTATDGWADGVAGHISVAFLAGPNKWVMLYGGGLPTLFDPVGGPLPATLNETVKTDGTIKLRIADNPWGPWSAPVVALSPFANDADDDGICRHLHGHLLASDDRCGGFALAPSYYSYGLGPGSLYGASIVEAWSTWTAATRKAEIGWVVSTWNPYEVHQMKSTITIPP